MKKTIFTIVIILLSLNCFCQYEIKLKINGVSDTVAYLVHHFGAKQYVIDTINIDKKGNTVIKGDDYLYKGIYMIILPSRDMNFFEILISDNKFFSIETDTADFVANMKIKNSPENLAFNEYQKKMSEVQKEYNRLNKEFEIVKDDPEKSQKIRDESMAINAEREKFMKDLIAKNPGTFFSKILLSLLEVEIPDPPKDDEGNIIDPNFQYLFRKDHFFDNIDFAENGLLRTPIYENKLDYYFKYMVVPDPDSLIVETNKIITKAYEGGDSLMFQYTLARLFNFYDSSKVMGYDAVFVAIAEDWYLSGKATWADSTFLSKVSERVEKITPNKIGNIAPDLVRMQSIDEKYYSLHQIQGDYTVLIFFEPNCGHCKKEVPKLMEELRDTLNKMNVKVFAFYTQYDKEEWKKFLDEKDLYEKGWYNVWDGPYPHSRFRDFYDIYSTPVIFILDKDKKIIGKRIGVENIKDLIEFEKKKKELYKK